MSGPVRVVAVLADPRPATAAPPGIDPAALGLAMLEDVVDLVSDLAGIAPVLLVGSAGGPAPDPAWRRSVADLAWPGTPVVDLGPGPVLPAALAAVAALAGPTGAGGVGPAGNGDAAGERGAAGEGGAAGDGGAAGGEAVIVAADAPDLPGLLIAKLFRGLARTAVAVCPAAGGGLVALGARLPAGAWLVGADPDLDAPDALLRLYGAAPRRADVHLAPGWHRLRSAADLGALDAGLEGWPATRALLRT
ncbi:MAG: hypothetical protein ACJ74O_12255 [Frankiaceae bacterium]